MMALEEARLQRRMSSRGTYGKPRGARSKLSRSDAGTLLIEVPAAGVTAGTLFGGAFSAAWFSAVGPATVSMFASGGAVSALFLLPFWLAGGLVVKQTILDPAKATSLSIGEFAWELQQRAAGVTISAEGGDTMELDGAVVDVAAYVNDMPVYVLRLTAGTAAWSVGGGLAELELDWLAGEINEQLESLAAEDRA